MKVKTVLLCLVSAIVVAGVYGICHCWVILEMTGPEATVGCDLGHLQQISSFTIMPKENGRRNWVS